MKTVFNRKPGIFSSLGYLASAHILTFEDSSLKSDHEKGSAAAKKVVHFGNANIHHIVTLKAGNIGNIYLLNNPIYNPVNVA